MTIRLDTQVKEKLERLAQNTKRSRSFLAAEAVSAYVDRELEIIDGIQRGLADMETDKMVPHAEAMAELYSVLEAGTDGKE